MPSHAFMLYQSFARARAFRAELTRWRSVRIAPLPQVRRNLSPDAFKLLLGRRYNRAKSAQGGTGANQYAQKAQFEPSASTADKLAEQHGVSRETVKRAGKFAATFALPSTVRGPVEQPPCHLHRFLPGTLRAWQGWPSRRRRAPQTTRLSRSIFCRRFNWHCLT
jgi:hypothetical protein